jgi:hypothetical protein
VKHGLLTILSLLSGTLWGTICSGLDVPASCRDSTGPFTDRLPIRDFSGALPIPDYLEAILACNGLSLTGARPDYLAPPSAWMDTEQRLYSAVLAKRKVDVLVVPFQVQGYGLDRIERAVMSADLAYAIGAIGQYSVADPFLVSRALGEGARRFDAEKVEDLATLLGAKKIVLAYVGHDERHSLFLTIQVRDPLPKPGEARPTKWQRDWRNVAFTDDRTPMTILHEMLPEILQSLPLKLATPVQASTVSSSAGVAFAVTPLQSVTTNVRRVPAAVLFNLLGAVNASDEELSRERLYEKALLASMRGRASDPRGRFLEAYALFNLQRRPSALARLSGLETPSVATLRGLLNGDLPTAMRAIAGVKDPLEQLLLQAAVRDLEFYYQHQPKMGLSAAPKVFGNSYPVWEELVAMRTNQWDAWSVPEAMTIKSIMDDNFPVPGMELKSMLAGMAVTRGDFPDDVDIDLATARHIRRAAETIPAARCCAAGSPEATQWDLLWLIEGLAESRIRQSFMRESHLRGLPGEALEIMTRLDPLFSGHPRLSAMRALAALDMHEHSRDDVRSTWLELLKQNSTLAAYWAQGQTRVAATALTTLGIPSEESKFLVDAYSHDYPSHPYWPVWYFDMYEHPHKLVDFMVEALAFSSNEIDPLWRLSDATSPPEYRAMLIGLGSRFAGHPMRKDLFGLAGPETGEPAPDRLVQLRAAIESDPEVWDNYYELASAIIKSGGQYDDASRALLSYPEFHKQNPAQRVGLSNEAVDAGSLLYWQGQPDLAKPFYQIAADLDTGSEASMRGDIRLKVLATDYAAATVGLRRRAIRYPSAYSHGEYLSYLHAFGLSDEAWAGFAQVMADFEPPTVWESALVGHRRAGIDERTVRAWLQKPEVRAARFKTRRFAPYYAILWNSTERTPPADLGALVETLEGPPVAHIDVDGRSLLRPHRIDPSGFEFVMPSPFRVAQSPKVAPGTAFKSDLAYFADAYSALRRKNYKIAVVKFVAMADRYPIEGPTAGFALPYFAYAAAKSGDTVGLEKYVEALPDKDFDYWLSRAFFAGARKDISAAQSALAMAFRTRPQTGQRPIMTEYQYAEACEWVYQETRDPRFAAMLLDWVKVFQRLQPTYAWAFAMQYTYEKPGNVRMRALAFTHYLDPASERIKAAPKADLNRAEAWFKDHNPFDVHKDLPEAVSASLTSGLSQPADLDPGPRPFLHGPLVDEASARDVLDGNAERLEQRDFLRAPTAGDAAQHELAEFTDDVGVIDHAFLAWDQKVTRLRQHALAPIDIEPRPAHGL